MAEWLRRQIRIRCSIICFGFRAQVQILLVSFCIFLRPSLWSTKRNGFTVLRWLFCIANGQLLTICAAREEGEASE